MKKILYILLLISGVTHAQSVLNINQLPSAITSGKANQTTYLGYIYNKTGWTTGTLASDFTGIGGVSVTISGSNQVYSGGTGSFTQVNNLNGGSCIEYSKETLTYIVGTVNSTSYGIGPSFYSSNTGGAGIYNIQAQYNTSTSGGQLKIFVGNTASLTAVSTAPGTITPVAGDTVIVTLERSKDIFTATAYDKTAKSTVIYATYTYPTIYLAAYIMPNTGNFGIASYGGTQTLVSYSVSSQERKKAYICVVGDSKAVGYYSGGYSLRYASLIGKYYDVIVSAGGYDKTSDVLLHIQQIIALAPTSVILSIGCNDIRNGVSSATYLANYASIVNQLTAAGISIYHLLPLYENSGINQTTLKNYIITNYASTYIDTKLETYAGTASNVLVADNVHPNTLGHQIIANSIVSSGFFNLAVAGGSTGAQSLDNVLTVGNISTQSATFGSLAVNAVLNGDLLTNITNTSTGTSATSAYRFGYDGTHFANFSYTGSGYTTNGLITSGSLNFYNNSGITNFLNSGASNFNFAVGGIASTNNKFTIAANGIGVNTTTPNTTIAADIQGTSTIDALAQFTRNNNSTRQSGVSFITTGTVTSSNPLWSISQRADGTNNIYLQHYDGTTLKGDIGITTAGVLSFPQYSTGIAHIGSTGILTSSTIVGSDLSSTIVLPSGSTATTQSPGDNSTKLATTAYADAVGNYAPTSTTTVSGSTSGSVDVTGITNKALYKKVIVWGNSMVGNVTITFPFTFTHAPTLIAGSTSLQYTLGTTTTTGTTFSSQGATPVSGYIIFEGY